MNNTNIVSARSNFYKLASSCIKYGESFNITTKRGNVILLSENDYNNLVESFYLLSNKSVREDIIKTIKAPTSSFNKKAPF